MTLFRRLGLGTSTGAGSAVISAACPSISLALVDAPRDPLLKVLDHRRELVVAQPGDRIRVLKLVLTRTQVAPAL